jgi:hypothetical protein
LTNRLHATLFVCLVPILVAAPRLGAQVTLTFANLADGPDGNGVWTSGASFVNTSPGDNSCTWNIIGPNGKPLVLGTKTMGRASTFAFSMPQGGTQEIDTTGGGGTGGAVVNAWSQATCTNPFTGGVTYTYNVAGQPFTSVGVLNQYPSGALVSQANASTAFALANPNATSALTATITANGLNGILAGTTVLTAPPLGQMVFNLGNVIVTTPPNSFQGSVTITGNQLFLGLAIGVQTNPGNATNPAGSFVVSNIPSISFEPKLSFTGTFTIDHGPDAGATGTFTLTNLAPYDSEKYNGTISITFNGTTTSGPVSLTRTIAGKTYWSLWFQESLAPFPNGAEGLSDVQEGGTILGVWGDPSSDGNQGSITFTQNLGGT